MIPDTNEKKDTPDEKKDEEKTIKELLEKADADQLEIIKRLGNLYQVVNAPGYLNIDRLKNAVDSLSEFNKIQEYDYLHNLLKKKPFDILKKK